MSRKVSRFEELLKRGRGMSLEERRGDVQRLMLDEGFAGVLGFLEGLKAEFVASAADQTAAERPGKQCHLLGSVFGLDCVLAELRGMEPRVKRAADGEAEV